MANTAPLAEWELPAEFATLRRLMEARMLKMGRRECVQVLRLLETFGMEDLYAAVRKAPKLGAVGFAVGFDAVKHLVPCQVEARIAYCRVLLSRLCSTRSVVSRMWWKFPGDGLRAW